MKEVTFDWVVEGIPEPARSAILGRVIVAVNTANDDRYINAEKDAIDRVPVALKSLPSLVCCLLKALPPIESHAEFSVKHSANSPSSHQEVIREDQEEIRIYRKAKMVVEACLRKIEQP